MSRSKWKGNFIDNSIYKLISKKRLEKKEQTDSSMVLIRSRRSTVLKNFVGKEVWIYTGKIFTKKKIKEQMVGHKFGEFSFTRSKYEFRRTKKK